MILHLVTIVLGSHLLFAAADGIPQFDVEPSCRAMENTDIKSGRTVAMCKSDEQDARNQLGSQWAEFPQSDQRRCTELTRIGGTPSYVELLVCLEMAREVKNLHNDEKNSTTGQGR